MSNNTVPTPANPADSRGAGTGCRNGSTGVTHLPNHLVRF